MKRTMAILVLMTVNAHAGIKLRLYNMGAFENGALVFLAADTVNIRSAPVIGNNIIDNLPVGYQVRIEKKSDSAYIVDGLKAPWYLVSHDSTRGPVKGYVWGGFLSIAALPVQYRGNPALFLFTIKSAKNSGAIPVHAMIASGGKIVSAAVFDAIGVLSEDRSFGYSVSAELHGPRGFSGISNILTLEFSYGACGYPFGAIVLMYNGSDIMYGSTAISTVESGVFHSLSKFIYPDEKGGIQNGLVLVQTLENFDDGKKSYALKETKKTALSWTGNKFIEVK
ncbi:MAG TPA: SH3 domain-containing protein [Spirochaetota bacterium]|nr:SH3 domain-containing protein [Spirochaetota bacterium]HPL15355.1 SH3 domain-containing protein [Spirochaetota bacterium]HQJ70031.1 SH3 domain-containing protein [Spirochaetota bacterium]HRS76844.1 SH3 domain-containing protein [Spirochaetota bacterium]HRT74412.1 SH3 domain-containing protein [Spirochaetota bacterium]